MGTARDIAVIFLSIQGLIIALVPLALISGLAYGVYRLHRLVRVYLRKAQAYARQGHDAVERASKKVAEPFISAHALWQAVTTVTENLIRRLH